MRFNLGLITKQNEKWSRKKTHEWPDPKKKLNKTNATRKQLNEFKKLVKRKSGETEIQ